MSSGTDGLIERLAAAAEPVQRLRPPVLRAGLWLAAVTAALAAAIVLFADVALFARRAGDAKLALELTGTGLTGILAASFPTASGPSASRATMARRVPSASAPHRSASWLASTNR